MVPDGVPCGCGNKGCLESYASGRALVRRSREEAGRDPTSAEVVLAEAGGSVDGITGPLVTEAAQRGDPFAVARFAELGDQLFGSGAPEADDAVVVTRGDEILVRVKGDRRDPRRLLDAGNQLMVRRVPDH